MSGCYEVRLAPGCFGAAAAPLIRAGLSLREAVRLASESDRYAVTTRHGGRVVWVPQARGHRELGAGRYGRPAGEDLEEVLAELAER